MGARADCEIGLAETALLLAAITANDRAVDDRLAMFTRWGDDLVRTGAAEAEARAAALARVLRHFQPDSDEAEADSGTLPWVLDHGRGTSDALGIVWIEAASRAGWVAHGLAFPTHFLVRLEDCDGHRVIVDPCAGGAKIAPPDLRALLKAGSGLAAELEPAHFAPLGNRDILMRLQDGLKMRLLRGGDLAHALVVVEAMLTLAPDRALSWREAGLMHMRLDNLPAAVAALEQFVARTGNGAAKRRTQQLLQEIRGRMS